MDSIAILGPGGVGGFLAAALARAGLPVRIVAREETAEHIARHGLRVRSERLGDFEVHPPASATLREECDVLFVATKAVGLKTALARIRQRPRLIVPLLNGLEHMSTLKERYGTPHVAAGTIRIESDRPEPGLIVQSSPFLRVDMASRDPGILRSLDELAGVLERAEVPATVESNEAQILWSKLVRLNALALTTSAADRPVGFIRSDPEWRVALEGCIEEASAVARAEGAQVDAAERLAELDQAHPGLGSSMQRDIAAGREPELDAIAGSVLRVAERHELGCPTIARLTVQVARRAGIPVPRLTWRSERRYNRARS
jgi:2-dehydropantoate 2-reductase